MENIILGYAFCGSFCTMKKSVEALRELSKFNIKIKPIMSQIVYSTDTRFGKASDFIEEVEDICKEKIIHTIDGAEPIGPKNLLDIIVVSPCTGNTLSKLASGVSDTSVTLAAKATLRADRPVLVALCSNDALGANLANIGALLNRKNFYFVPMYMDDKEKKPHSLVADFSLVAPCLADARNGIQRRPLFLT